MPVMEDNAIAPSQFIADDELYDDGYLHLEYRRYYVTFGGRPFYHFTRKEFFILARLTRDYERVVTAEELWQAAWDKDEPFNVRSLRVHIMTLRRKLLPFDMDIMTTVHMGYRLTRHVTPRDAENPNDPLEPLETTKLAEAVAVTAQP